MTIQGAGTDGDGDGDGWPTAGRGTVVVSIFYGGTSVTKRVHFGSANPRYAGAEAWRVGGRALLDATRVFGDPRERPPAPDDLI